MSSLPAGLDLDLMRVHESFVVIAPAASDLLHQRWKLQKTVSPIRHRCKRAAVVPAKLVASGFSTLMLEFHLNPGPRVSIQMIKIWNKSICIYIYIYFISMFLYLGFYLYRNISWKCSFMNVDKSSSFGACQVGPLSCLLVTMASQSNSSVYTHFRL